MRVGLILALVLVVGLEKITCRYFDQRDVSLRDEGRNKPYFIPAANLSNHPYFSMPTLHPTPVSMTTPTSTTIFDNTKINPTISIWAIVTQLTTILTTDTTPSTTSTTTVTTPAATTTTPATTTTSTEAPTTTTTEATTLAAAQVTEAATTTTTEAATTTSAAAEVTEASTTTSAAAEVTEAAIDASTTVEPETDNCICGRSNNDRIVGGSVAQMNEFPWMAYLEILSDEGLYVCGGSLITNKHILTAAHCVIGVDQTNVDVQLAVLNTEGQESPVVRGKSSRIAVHPGYHAKRNQFDAAIITLKESVNFTRSVSPVCLPTGEPLAADALAGQMAVIAGWGTTRQSGSTSNILLKAMVEVVSDDQCRKAYRNKNIDITPEMICAGGDGKDSCQGDSGGPIMYQDVEKFISLGVVSFGVGCAQPGVPGVYARTTSIMPFINEQIGSASNCI